MEKKKGPRFKTGAMGGKGFYIVLCLCAAVIGVSSWILLADVGTNVDTAEAMVDISDAIVTTLPAGTPMETEKPAEETDAEPAPLAEETAAETEAQTVFAETVTSYVWPVQGDVVMPYAVQTLLYDSTMADWRTHAGIDIACELGEQVLASAPGIVVSVVEDELYGTTVEIDHANGVHTVYANLSADPPVGEGDRVTMGQVIGAVGNTALGEVNQVAHLHFATTLDGAPADPFEYLPED